MYEGDIYGGEGEPKGKLMRYDSLPFSLPLNASRSMYNMRSNCGWIARARKRSQRRDEMRQEENKKKE